MENFDYESFVAQRKSKAEKMAREYFYNQKQRKPYYWAEGETLYDEENHNEVFMHFTDEEVTRIKQLIIDTVNADDLDAKPVSTVQEAIDCLSYSEIFEQNEELRHLLHERHITVHERDQGLSGPRPFQVLSIAPGPLPGIVQIEDGLHVPLPKFCQKTVQSLQNCIIIHARLLLEGRLNAGEHAVGAIPAHQDAEVVDTQSLEGVQFPDKAVKIASLPLGRQDGSVPEIGSNIRIRTAITDKLAVLDPDEGRRCCLDAASGDEKGDSREQN